MGNLIRGARVGSIVRTLSRNQYFYVHNIHNNTMYMSGVSVDGWRFEKGLAYFVNEVVPQEEEHIFYDLLNKFNYKLNLNTGVVRC